jgi:hypothetical protein
MRTTLSLDDDVFDLANSYAKSRSLGLGKAVSELVRKGLSAPTPTRIENGLMVFDVPPDSPPITAERIRELESEVE